MTEEKKPPKEFENKFLKFPTDNIDEVNVRINKGEKADVIRKYLVEKYKGPFKIPNRKTIIKYIKWYKSETSQKSDSRISLLKENSYTMSEIRDMMRRLNVGGMDISDHKAAIEKIAQFMMVRLQLTSQIQDRLLDAKFEQVITNQVGEIHAMLKTLLEHEDKMGIIDFIIFRMTNKFLEEFAPVVSRAYEETPQKDLKGFLEKIQKYHKSIDLNRIRDEAIAESKTLKKGASNGKEIRTNAA